MKLRTKIMIGLAVVAAVILGLAVFTGMSFKEAAIGVVAAVVIAIALRELT